MYLLTKEHFLLVQSDYKKLKHRSINQNYLCWKNENVGVGAWGYSPLSPRFPAYKYLSLVTPLNLFDEHIFFEMKMILQLSFDPCMCFSLSQDMMIELWAR